MKKWQRPLNSMKKFLLLLSLLMCDTSFAGQNVTGNLTVTNNVGIGTTIVDGYAMTIMNGNVGIGTFSKGTFTLSVNDRIGVGARNQDAQIELVGSPTPVLRIRPDSTTKSPFLEMSHDSTGNEAFVINENSTLSAQHAGMITFKLNNDPVMTLSEYYKGSDTGPTGTTGLNVGIGTTLPVGILDIQRGFVVQSTNIGTANVGIGYIGGVNGGLAVNGNVGIGTTMTTSTPYPLDVFAATGESKIRVKTKDSTNFSNISIENNINKQARLIMIGSAQNYPIASVLVNNATLLTSDNNTYIQACGGSGTLGDCGVYFSSGLDGAGVGPATMMIDGTGNVAIGTTITGTTNGRLVVIGGNVGIGSVHPGSTLDIQGQVRGSQFSGQSSGTLLCVRSGGGIGYCSGAVAGISCTCN